MSETTEHGDGGLDDAAFRMARTAFEESYPRLTEDGRLEEGIKAYLAAARGGSGADAILAVGRINEAHIAEHGHPLGYSTAAAAIAEVAPAPPTRGDQAEVARLREDLDVVSAAIGMTGSEVAASTWMRLRAALSPTSSAEPQAAAAVGEPDKVSSAIRTAARSLNARACSAALAVAPVTGDRETAGVEHEALSNLQADYDAAWAENGRMRVALSRIAEAPAWGAPDRWEVTPAEVRMLARQAIATPPSGGGDHAAKPQAPDGGVVKTAKAILRNTHRSPLGERAWVTVGDIRPLAEVVVRLAQRPPGESKPEGVE